jgi:hypothetical protein
MGYSSKGLVRASHQWVLGVPRWREKERGKCDGCKDLGWDEVRYIRVEAVVE